MSLRTQYRGYFPLLLASASAFACDGYVKPEGDAGPSIGTGGAGTLGTGGAGTLGNAGSTSSTAGSSTTAGSAGTAANLPLWSGAVGSWCGPGDNPTTWLVARPQSGSMCQAQSAGIYDSATPATPAAEGFSLELPTASLTTFPANVTATGRYCSAGGASCSDVEVTLSIASYTQGQGAAGTWSFTPPGAAMKLEGRIEASWCAWDDFLPAHPEGERLARGIAIREVAVYQGVKVPLVQNMVAVTERNADLVQQREALLRVFVEPGASFQSRELSARVTLQDGTAEPQRFEQTMVVSGASNDATLSSTFNIELPKEAFKADTKYSVELRETSKCTALEGVATGARFPETGTADVGARFTGTVKVLLVPVRYDADGSGRLPDTSAAQLEQMSTRLYSMYPTSEVLLTVREAVGTTATDLGDMLDQVRDLRDEDAPPSDLSYYGMVRQAEDFRDYCQGGCTTGIAGFGSQQGVATAGMGIGFIDRAAGTFVHELGHIHRLPHAPCGGAAGPDENYPYAEGALGSWGYDLDAKEFFDPAEYVDFMSYCSPEWVSDYNYQLLLERVILVNERATMKVLPPPGGVQEWRTVLVSDAGASRWGLSLRPTSAPPGDPISAVALDAQGNPLAQVVAYSEQVSHGERAFFVPIARAGWHSILVPGAAPLAYSATTSIKPFTR